MQFGWPRRAEELVPGIGPDPHDAGKPGFKVAKLHGAKYSGRSAQNERMMPRVPEPGFSVTTRKIAARVSGATTACGMLRAPSVSCGPGELTAIRTYPVKMTGTSMSWGFNVLLSNKRKASLALHLSICPHRALAGSELI